VNPLPITSQNGVLTSDQLLALAPVGLAVGLLLAAGIGADVVLLVRARALAAEWRNRAKRLGTRPWEWNQALRLCFLVVALNLVSNLVTKGAQWWSGAAEPSMPLALALQTAWIPLTLAAWLACHLKRRRLSWRATFGKIPASPGRTLLTAGLFFLAVLPPIGLAAWASDFILTRLGIPPESQLVVQFLVDPKQPRWLQWYLCFAAVGIAPIVEEIGFRGILLPALSRVCGPWLAVAAVSALFAGVHFNLVSFLPLFVLAMGLSVAYVLAESVLSAILIHALFNGVSISALLYFSHVGIR